MTTISNGNGDHHPESITWQTKLNSARRRPTPLDRPPVPGDQTYHRGVWANMMALHALGMVVNPGVCFGFDDHAVWIPTIRWMTFTTIMSFNHGTYDGIDLSLILQSYVNNEVDASQIVRWCHLRLANPRRDAGCVPIPTSNAHPSMLWICHFQF